MGKPEIKPPLKVRPFKVSKTMAKDLARAIKKFKKQGDIMIGPPAQGWCKACDRDEEHAHTIRMPE